MRKFSAVIAFIFIMILCLCSCGKSSSSESQSTAQPATDSQTTAAASENGIDTALIGNWQEDVFDSGFIFNEDGTGTDTFWDLTFTYSTEGGEVLIVYDTDMYGASSYKYEISGDTLTMTRLDDEENSSFTYTKADESATATAETESSDSFGEDFETYGETEAEAES